jgi:hypothetical protein
VGMNQCKYIDLLIFFYYLYLKDFTSNSFSIQANEIIKSFQGDNDQAASLRKRSFTDYQDDGNTNK